MFGLDYCSAFTVCATFVASKILRFTICLVDFVLIIEVLQIISIFILLDLVFACRITKCLNSGNKTLIAIQVFSPLRIIFLNVIFSYAVVHQLPRLWYIRSSYTRSLNRKLPIVIATPCLFAVFLAFIVCRDE